MQIADIVMVLCNYAVLYNTECTVLYYGVLYCAQVGAQMDVKLRSLICLGLNEGCLHLW